jgi:hypothetical protein
MEKYWHMLRVKRDKLLVETDKTQLADFPIDTKKRGQYREYRVYLRNLPSMYDDKTVKDAKIKSFEEWVNWRRNGDY